MTEPKPEPPIVGYVAIAAAVTRALSRSCDERTARRWAHQDPAKRPQACRARLPVVKFPDGRVYLLPADLRAWAAAWLTPMPTGAVLPGRSAAA